MRIESNRVFENSWYSRYASSGISILAPFPTHAHDPGKYSHLILGNKVWSNRTLVKWKRMNRYSDGNGIIVDYYRGNSFSNRVLVAGNLSWNNGGSGIHAFNSDEVHIIGNTSWHNSLRYNYGEIYAHRSSNTLILGNIMVARMGAKINYPSGNDDNRNSTVFYQYNIYHFSEAPYFVGPDFSLKHDDPMAPTHERTLPSLGLGDQRSDPLMKRPHSSPAWADFSLAPNSVSRWFVEVPVPDAAKAFFPRLLENGKWTAGAFE